MVTGVRADVAVKLFGDDLDALMEKANEIAKVATGIRGTQDTQVDRVGGQQYLTIDIDRQAHCALWIECGRCERRDRDGDRRKVRDGDLRGRAAFPGRGAFARQICATAWRTFANSADQFSGWTTHSAERPGRRSKVVEGPAQINREHGQAAHRGRGQCAGPRPGRICGGTAGEGGAAGAAAGRATTSSGAGSSTTWSARCST